MVDPLTRRQHSYIERAFEAAERLTKALEGLAEQQEEKSQENGDGATNAAIVSVDADTPHPFGVETAQEQVKLNLRDCTLPVDEERREDAVADLTELVQSYLATQTKYKPTDATAVLGHQYAEVKDQCPDCGEDLDLTDYNYTNNGANAKATCPDYEECGWQGSIVYKATDLVDQGIGGGSVVRTGEISPDYIPY